MALVVGRSLTFFMLAGGGLAVLVFWAGVAVAEHAHPVLPRHRRRHGLCAEHSTCCAPSSWSIELREKEQEAALAAEAANLGTLTRDIPRDVIEASDEWRELFGFTPRRAADT